MRIPILFVKALRAGERWITVHPHGSDEKGQPVLVSEQKDGSYKVIGGAGGKLNHLKLTGVKPQGQLSDKIRERASMRRDEKKKQRERDKALGLKEKKAEVHARITDMQREHNRKFIDGVSEAMGWKPEDVAFDETKHTDLADHVKNKLRLAHEAEMMKRAVEAVDLNRRRMLSDADARAETDLGEVPLTTENPDQLSVQDLDPVRSAPAGLGFSTKYGERAEAAGLSGDELKSEAEAAKQPRTEGQAKALKSRGEVTKLVQQNLELLRDGDQAERLRPKLVEAKKALDLLKLEKKRKLADQQARAARKKLEGETVVEPKAYVIEVSDADVDAKVADDVSNELRTIATRAFLSEAEKSGAADIARHVGVGAYNSVNALALAAGGAALVDRSVVDVLGVAGAAQVLARRLMTDLKPEELERVVSGVEEFHVHHYMEASAEAVARAKELQDEAKEIELGTAETGGDLAALQEINHRRGEAIAEAQKVLGQAFGEMEANAALVYALRRGKSDKPFQVPLGKVSAEDAIRQVRAIGLQRGDYSLETVAGNRVLSVSPAGLDRLSKPVNRADLEQVRRNLDIIEGKYDEENWLPGGVSDRPDLDMHLAPGVAPQLAQPFQPSGDLGQSVRDYIGGRAADGDSPADILADLQSADFYGKVGRDRADAYSALLDELAPLRGADGKLRPAEALRPAFEKLADDYVSSAYGASRAPIHRQTFAVDEKSTDALHRALAAEPAGTAAYKQIGELTGDDQRTLREFFHANVARESPEGAAARHDLERLERNEPTREATDMFGERTTNPEWSEWKQRRDEMAAAVNSASLNWPKYVESMHGQDRAYGAIQDLIRSKVSKSFADTYNKVNPSAPLKIGRSVIRNNLNHLDAVDPAKRDARMEEERALTDRLRNRARGQYASGSVRDKLDRAREQEAGLQAAQMGFFANDGDLAGEAVAEEKPMAADERYSIGHEAERRIAEMMPRVGQNFRRGEPIKMGRPAMSGGKNWARQRGIKMIEANKRVALSFGVGTGKTLVGLSGFTNLQQKGKAKRGLFLVPSIVQGQFGGEALRFLKPGTFNWHCEPGASREERLAAYKDPAHHFCVMTHQAFRDDMVHLAAKQAQTTPEEMAAKVDGMPRAARKEWLRHVAENAGINFDYLMVDEGHNTLNRKGKENSSMANVIDAMSDSSGYYVSASGDPVKNDVSEAFSLLQKMDPERYTDQDAFLRKYGVDTIAAKDELRREMARFQYPSKIDPDVIASKVERKVELSSGQRKAMADLDRNLASARLARMQGKTDTAALKAISPESFKGVPDDKHDAVASELQKSIGILKASAVRAIINAAPDSGKLDEVVKIAAERQGKPGVVFAHSLKAVEQIKARLEREGHRVVALTGKDTAAAKEAKRRQFNPDTGDAAADILVASDAGATGMNVQRGQWCAQYDVPDTAKTHAQRFGRINRTGQKNNVELIDILANHPEEQRAKTRLETKYALRELMTTPMESLDDTGVAYFLKNKSLDQHGPAR